MESLLPPNTPEAYIYASIYTALDEVRATQKVATPGYLERELNGYEHIAAFYVLGKYPGLAHRKKGAFPDEIVLSWISEPAKPSVYREPTSVEVGYIHFNFYNSESILYIFTKTKTGELFCSKEILDEHHAEDIEEARLQKSLTKGEPKREVTYDELHMLSEMMGAILSLKQ